MEKRPFGSGLLSGERSEISFKGVWFHLLVATASCAYAKKFAFANNCQFLQAGSPNLWEASFSARALGFEASGQLFRRGARFQGLSCNEALTGLADFYKVRCFKFFTFLFFWVFIPGRWGFAFLLLGCLMRGGLVLVLPHS